MQVMGLDILVFQTLALLPLSTLLQHQIIKILGCGYFKSMESLLKIMVVHRAAVWYFIHTYINLKLGNR
jgi:hypothetical protein